MVVIPCFKHSVETIYIFSVIFWFYPCSINKSLYQEVTLQQTIYHISAVTFFCQLLVFPQSLSIPNLSLGLFFMQLQPIFTVFLLKTLYNVELRGKCLFNNIKKTLPIFVLTSKLKAGGGGTKLHFFFFCYPFQML